MNEKGGKERREENVQSGLEEHHGDPSTRPAAALTAAMLQQAAFP